MTEYVSVNIKKDFAKKIDEEYKKRTGFNSRSEYIRYCVQKVMEDEL